MISAHACGCLCTSVWHLCRGGLGTGAAASGSTVVSKWAALAFAGCKETNKASDGDRRNDPCWPVVELPRFKSPATAAFAASTSASSIRASSWAWRFWAGRAKSGGADACDTSARVGALVRGPVVCTSSRGMKPLGSCASWLHAEIPRSRISVLGHGLAGA